VLQRLTRGRGMPAITSLARRLAGPTVPLWTLGMPMAAPPLPRGQRDGAVAVYVPACVSRVFGSVHGEAPALSLPQAVVIVAARAGQPVWIPADVHGTCCGTPFSSKGFATGQRHAANDAVERCWRWSDSGRLPIVVDANSCTHGLRECAPSLTAENRSRLGALRILDSVEFAHRTLLPRLIVVNRLRSVAVHPTCSLAQMGSADELFAVAAACAEQVVHPSSTGCCGFAGDRGFLFPELTAAATRAEAADVRAANCDAHVSANRMCEVAMSSATGRPYRSVLHLLEVATRPQ
jgi:D-lactate dehydrogenase